MSQASSSMQQWMLETTNIATKLNALEKECAPIQSKYCALRHLQKNDLYSTRTNSNNSSLLTNCNDKKSKKESIILLESSISFYRKEFASLRNYCSKALGFTKIINNAASSSSTTTITPTKNNHSLEAKKDCEKLIKLYEKSIHKISSYMKLEMQVLLKEYVCLEGFLQSTEAKISKWPTCKCYNTNNNKESYEIDETIASNEKNNSSPNNSTVNDSSIKLAKLVSKLNIEIANNGGNTGSWKSNDHQVFLKAWTLAKGDYSNIMKRIEKNNFIRRELVHHTEDEIMMHVTWFIQYQHKCDMKKKLVTKWRMASATAVKETHNLPQCMEEEKDAAISDFYCRNTEITGNTNCSSYANDDGMRKIEIKKSDEIKNKKELVRLWKKGKDDKARRLREEEMIQKDLKHKKDKQRRQKLHENLRSRISQQWSNDNNL